MEVLLYRGSRAHFENRYKVKIMHLEGQFFFKEQKDAVFMRRLIVCLCGPRHKGRMRLPVPILASHPI